MVPQRRHSAGRTKVLFLLNDLRVGGAEKHVVSLLNGLDRDRFATSLVCLKADDSLAPQIQAGACDGGITFLGVKAGLDFGAVRRLAGYLSQQQPDVVVCTNMYAYLFAWLARGRYSSARLVEVFHTTEVSSRKEGLSMWLYRLLVRQADLLVYVSHNQAQYWRARHLRARLEAVIHNGIDTAHFTDRWSDAEKLAYRQALGLAATDYVIGICAVLRPEKEHADLLRSMARLGGEVGSVKCMIIGDGPERPAVESLIDELGLRDRVRITGFMPDVRLAVASCDVMALTSHAVETFSISALESMSLGKPMVMTNIGGAAEQVTDGVNGFLYPKGNIDALTDCIRRLAEPVARAEMGRQAASLVRQTFDVSTMVAAFETRLASLAGTEPRAALVPGPASRV